LSFANDNQPEERTQGRSPRRGLRFFLMTWTGRLLLINAAVFLVMIYFGGSVLLPSSELLVRFGAKAPAGLAHGEYWRLLTSMFVHVGIIHFALNALALYYIGPQIEALVGRVWFLVIYFAAGIIGAVASAVFTTGISAGASGAIFGLLGVGLVFERVVASIHFRETGDRLRKGNYTGLVIANLVIGFIISSGNTIGIDNAAHLGGLFAGCAFTFGMLKLKPNRLLARNPLTAAAIFAMTIAAAAAGTVVGTNPKYIKSGLLRAAEKADGPQAKFQYFSEAIAVDPADQEIYFQRGRLLILYRQPEDAMDDFQRLKTDPAYLEKMQGLVAELRTSGMTSEAEALQGFLAER